MLLSNNQFSNEHFKTKKEGFDLLCCVSHSAVSDSL